jgi:uncharacterized protein (DUF433 family)
MSGVERKRDVCSGNPVIAGTRVTVRAIKEFTKAGYSVAEIRREYPTLSEEQIRDGIAYDG